MGSFKAACVQMRSTRDVSRNVADASSLIREAAAGGASYVQTPEMTNILCRDREVLFASISPEETCPELTSFRALADELGIWLHIGSIAVAVADGGAANRGFLIAPDGRIAVRYDKIHMFDVDLPNGESWRESRTYRPGDHAVVWDLPWLRLGMAICYDVRFPALFRRQAREGATLLSVPAAFTRQTGAAHWHVLLRSRAIENGAFVVAAAQGGHHEDGRETFGHSMIVDPWGGVLAEADHDDPCVISAVIQPAEAAKARERIPVLANERVFDLDSAGVSPVGASA